MESACKQQTNLDWLRSFGKAEFLTTFGCGVFCELVSGECIGDCEKCLDAWFGQPHEGGEQHMKKYRKGDPCPCCGQPIKTDNPEVLYLLSWIADMRRIPAVEEIETIHRLYISRKEQEHD